MTKLLLILLFVFVQTAQLFSQNVSPELTIRNQQLLNRCDAEQVINILVKGDKKNIQSLCKKYDAQFLYNIKDLCRVSIVSKQIQRFAQEAMVLRLGDFSSGGQALMDTARLNNNVDSVHMGYAPLTQAYTGNGVLFGLIDDGIDFNHPDFKNPDSTTRIKFIWDQNYPGSASSPLPYSYGKEWNFMDINNGMCTHVEQGVAGHGTHVTGIAAGNGNANPNFRANAPNCDIIAVSIKYGVDFLTNVVDAVDYIYKKADAIGKPCVINTSIGDYYGARDGKDITSQAIDYLLDEKAGRILVAAAGNAGNISYHGAYLFTGTDTIFSCFKDRAYSNKYYFDFFADTQYFRNAYFAVGAIDTGTYVNQGSTGYLNIIRDMPTLPFVGSVTMVRNIVNPLGFYRGQVKFVAHLEGGTYHVECEVTPDSSNKYWSLKFCGEGKANVWAEKSLIGTSNFASDSVLLSMTGFIAPDVNQTIVSSWQCSNNVITVGSYVNRNAFLNYDSTYTFNTEVAGNIAASSSHGPTRDGRVKPDIAAPGNYLLSCVNLRWFPVLLSTGQSFKVAYGGYYVRNSGTSMASPQVAGAMALLLEKYPNLKPLQAKEILYRTARIDTFTTNSIPNTVYGYGKLNTFQSMKYPALFGCTDTNAFNYNPLANISDDNCIPRVYGCMDSSAINFNPLANSISATDTCVYASTVGMQSLMSQTGIKVFPNPTQDQLHFELPVGLENITLHIFDVRGSSVLNEVISKQSYIWNCATMARGIYIYKVEAGLDTYMGKIILK